MPDQKSHKASITIAGKPYPLNLSDFENKHLHSIEKQINKKITEYQKSFSNLSLQDCLSMVLISQSFELEKVKGDNTKHKELDSALETIESTLG